MVTIKTTSLEQKINNRTAVIGVIGMGYVGLQVLDAFGKKGFPLIGFDVDAKKVEKLKKGDSTLNYLPLPELFAREELEISTKPSVLQKADCIIIAVPTPVDSHKVPDFRCLRAAFQTAKEQLQEGQLFVLQSSTYPGTTEEEFLPLLESSKKAFHLAYVPEYSDPGNRAYQFSSVPHLVSSTTKKGLELVSLLYSCLGCSIFPCSLPRVAEAAKIYTNAYRLINISFANEMKLLFDRMGIDVWEVLEAAQQKPFGFTPFFPGLGAGGDCIPVDPHYLIWKARAFDCSTEMLDQASFINQDMPYQMIQKMRQTLHLKDKKILQLGVTYKRDVNGLQESPALKLLMLLSKEAKSYYHDPFITHLPNFWELDLESVQHFDCVVIAVDHSSYDFAKIVQSSKLIFDAQNATKGLSQEKVVKI